MNWRQLGSRHWFLFSDLSTWHSSVYVFSEISTCYTFGDPHFKTFDHELITFQGSCKYTMAASISPYPTPFEIITKSEARNRNPAVTYPKNMELHMFGHVIKFSRKSVKVNIILEVVCYIFWECIT